VQSDEHKGARPRCRPKKTWREVAEKDCQARKFSDTRVDLIDITHWRHKEGHPNTVVVYR